MPDTTDNVTVTPVPTDVTITAVAPTKVGFWGSVKSWVAGISKKIWAAFFPFLKTKAADFIADSWPIFVEGIKEAAAAKNVTSEERKKIAFNYITSKLKPLGKEYSSSVINAGIEIVYQTVKEETGIDVKAVVDEIKK